MFRSSPRIFLVVCAIFMAVGAVGGASVKELDKKIKSQQEKLEQLQKKMEGMETEKKKLKRQEESLTKALKRIESEIQSSTKRQVKLNQQIRDTERQIERISKDAIFFQQEGARWEEALLRDLGSYYVETVYPQRLRRNRMRETALRSLISLKHTARKDAGARRDLALQRENRLRNFRRTLTTLRIEQAKEIERHKQSQQEKGRLRETTQGKMASAELEVRNLRETEESLGELIAQLFQKKETTLAAQKEAELQKKTLDEKRGNFSWPAAGTVVAAFGKQIHSDLKIPVINNGVRIKTLSQSPVKCIEKGVVIYAADFRSYGQTVIVDHGGETFSIYGLLGLIKVSEGEKVAAGATVGQTGAEPEALLYFEIRNQGRPENPILWLSP